MLRALIVALALTAPGVAAAQQRAEQFPDSAIGIEVRGDDGTVIGRVDAVERAGNGRIVAAEIGAQEPGNAPYASRDLVAQANDNALERVSLRDNGNRVIVRNGETRTR